LEQKINRIFTEKYCLHPEASEGLCKGNIIKAHTIQRSGGLTAIAENGHVYSFNPFNPMISKGKINNEVDYPSLIGLNQASTFTGFCGFHDSKTFRKLETEPFESTQEKCFLLSYRAFSFELFKKRAALDSIDIFRKADTGLSLDQQRGLQAYVTSAQIAIEHTLDEMEDRKKIFDTSLSNNNYDTLKFLVVNFDRIPDILCSGGFNPEFDFQGKQLQNRLDFGKLLETIYFSLIITDNGGAAVFGWLDRSDMASTKFIRSLRNLNKSQIPDAIGRLAFEYLENVFFAPKFWNCLSQRDKGIIKNRANSGMVKRKNNCLANDGLKYLDTQIMSIDTNVDDLPIKQT
jgi:hypothetical protein